MSERTMRQPLAECPACAIVTMIPLVHSDYEYHPLGCDPVRVDWHYHQCTVCKEAFCTGEDELANMLAVASVYGPDHPFSRKIARDLAKEGGH